MHTGFHGRTAIVTGAAHGLGRAIAHALVQRGAHVWACDVLGDELERTADSAPTDGGGTIETLQIDVTDLAEVQNLVDTASARTGRVHVLVNNAGGVCGQIGRPVEEVTPEEWRVVFDVNVTGAFFCAQAVVPGMKGAGDGRIVNISSGAGLGISLTGIQAYASAKAAQIGLTRQLAHELGAFGIRVNNVAPGFFRSNPASEAQWQSYGTEGQARLLERIPLGRLGRPEDVAHAVVFLASDEASWITGQVLSVNGGM